MCAHTPILTALSDVSWCDSQSSKLTEGGEEEETAMLESYMDFKMHPHFRLSKLYLKTKGKWSFFFLWDL